MYTKNNSYFISVTVAIYLAFPFVQNETGMKYVCVFLFPSMKMCNM